MAMLHESLLPLLGVQLIDRCLRKRLSPEAQRHRTDLRSA
jgi:hypothetical protein